VKIFHSKKDLQIELEGLRHNKKTLTLVPTMGALHEGHLSLINYAKPLSDVIIASIFVNPTQFNDPNDLANYPRPLEQDIALLESVKCDILFLPLIDEMYPENDEPWHIDLGELDRIWEGERRPGHFQGVTQIVSKLFNLVQPDQACFGQKDFQQVMVIQKMIEIKNMEVKLLICPTVRNEKGLALSSRNARLSAKGRENALGIFQALTYIKTNYSTATVPQLIKNAEEIINSNDALESEYLSICETATLRPITNFEKGKSYVVLIVVWTENVRLIDNILINP